MSIKLCNHFKTGMTNLTDGSCPYCALSEAEYRTEIKGVSQIHPIAAKLPNGEIASNVYQAYDIGYEQGVKFRAGKHRAWIGPNGAFTQDKKRMEKWERKGFPFITLLSDARYDL